MSLRRKTFADQVATSHALSAEGALGREAKEDSLMLLSEEVNKTTSRVVAPFQSKFKPSDMRQLALVAHNHMKPAMRKFIETHGEILKKFRVTGTQTTMRMCREQWGEDESVEYGLVCTSGPLGGDAQIASLMCMEDLGGLFFFIDPLSAHPHQADIESLLRLANCANVLICPNTTSAMTTVHVLKAGLENGDRGMIPSFFETLESPAVSDYRAQQELALARAISASGDGRAQVASLDTVVEQPSRFLDRDSDEDASVCSVCDAEIDYFVHDLPEVTCSLAGIVINDTHRRATVSKRMAELSKK